MKYSTINQLHQFFWTIVKQFSYKQKIQQAYVCLFGSFYCFCLFLLFHYCLLAEADLFHIGLDNFKSETEEQAM